MTPKTSIVCPSCGWIAERTYVPVDNFASRYDGHLGFGRCNQCQTPMQRRERGARKQAQIRAEMAHWDEVTKRGR